MKSQLWHETRDLHHACEEHEVGAAMANGSPPVQWYADWLHALLIIHRKVDLHTIPEVRRVGVLEQDLIHLPEPNILLEPCRYVDTLTTERSIAGAHYVLLGAHLMGGEIMRRRLEGYPTKHLEWKDRNIALKDLKEIKERTDIAQEARNCFYALLKTMDEIKAVNEK